MDKWDTSWYPRIGTVIKTMKTRVRLEFRNRHEPKGKGIIKTYDAAHAKQFLQRLDK